MNDKSIKIETLAEAYQNIITEPLKQKIEAFLAIKAEFGDIVLPFDFSKVTDADRKEIEAELDEMIPISWQTHFGKITVRELFEGNTQRIFAKGVLDQSGIERYCLFFNKSRYIYCGEMLYEVLNLPQYRDYKGDFEPRKTANIEDIEAIKNTEKVLLIHLIRAIQLKVKTQKIKDFLN